MVATVTNLLKELVPLLCFIGEDIYNITKNLGDIKNTSCKESFAAVTIAKINAGNIDDQ